MGFPLFFFSEKLPISVPDAGHNRISVTEAQVFTLLKNLPSNKASPEIPPKLYKAAAGILAKPLTALIQQSISDSIVPDSWKISAVIPLPKSSSPSNTDELRPISLLPIPAKILERVILEFAKPYLLKEYGSDQYGFRNGSSTTCALINLHDHITKYLDITSVAGVQVIAYDFSKAFDRIKHDIIIKYLTACNMPAELISWISSYLTHRRQYVKIGTVHSLTKEVTSGVPQGSILGPFLFSVVVGSLTISNSDCRVIKYADDVTISIPIFKNRKNLHVSEIHETVVKWSSEYGLPLNTKKCKTLLIPRAGDCRIVQLPGVEHVTKLNILGVTFNSKCTWSDHIEGVARTASRKLFPLRLLKAHVDPMSLRIVYFGIMRSVMEYAAPLLLSLTEKDSQRLQFLQNRFHRLLCGKNCKKQCLPLLAERRNKLSTDLYKRALSQDQHLLKKTLCCVSAHGRGRFVLPTVRTTRRLNSFAIKAAMLLNGISS